VKDVRVQVEGLAEVRRNLKNLDPALQKELRESFVLIGQDIANDARSMVPSGGTGKAAGSIRAGMSGNNAYVAGGKKSVPYYGWLDFGSRKPKSDGSRETGPWRKSGAGPKGGRFIYKSISRNRPEIRRAVNRAFEAAKKNAFK